MHQHVLEICGGGGGHSGPYVGDLMYEDRHAAGVMLSQQEAGFSLRAG
jgi:hypothetical protein